MTRSDDAVKASVKHEDIETLIDLFQGSDWDEMHLEIEGLEIFLSNDPKATVIAPTTHPVVAPVPAPPPTAPQGMGHTAPPPLPAAQTSDAPLDWIAVTAPNLGTFYRSAKPGAAAYVELGQHVSEETELCLIEVMKLFTAVRAGKSGIIRRICVSDAEMVEYGQVLFYIEPA